MKHVGPQRVCLAVLVLILAYLLATCGPLTELEKTSERPNVILILSDDLDTPLLEEHSAHYPNLGRLAAEGLTFENAFVTDPLCCPSRATFLRSQYAHNHQIVGNWWPRGGSKKSQALGHEESTVATWLQDGGYRTVLIGKYMNDYYGTHVPDEWYGIAGGYRTDDLNENGRIEHYDPDRYHLDDVLDEMIGHLMETLKESEELDNTYIFFTSDNGYHMGQHRLTAGKWTAYEEDARVPLIVHGPGEPKGRTLSH
jgi:N-acetylglucosamine-6-sulfatase